MVNKIIHRCNICKKLLTFDTKEFLEFKDEYKKVYAVCRGCAHKTAKVSSTDVVIVGSVALKKCLHAVREQDLKKYKKCGLIDLRKKELDQIEMNFFDLIRTLSNTFPLRINIFNQLGVLFREYKIKARKVWCGNE